ncbi:MAG: polymer-forming cytoskeletal protein [Vulcanimicrobiaceae bacterium]
MICRRPVVGILAIVALFFFSSHLAKAQFGGWGHHHGWTHHGSTYLFHNVTIPPGDVVNGDLNVIFGNAVVEGVVNGDLNVVGGSCDTSSGVVNGDVNCVQTASMTAIAPWVGSWADNIPFVEQTNRLSSTLAANLIVFFMFLLFPLRVRLALARVEMHPGLSAIVGTLGFVAVVPLAILLVLSIIGIPLVLLEIAAVLAFVFIGQGAIALLVGRRLAELVRPNTTPTPLMALVLGLVFVSAAEIVPLVGWAVTALICLVGFGAAILGVVPFTPSAVSLGTATPSGGSRPTIGGPPMTSR